VIFRLTVMFGVFALSMAAALAQAPDTSAKKAKMAAFDQMIGNWRGTGWIQVAQSREEFSGTEIVQKKIDGLAVLVEGRFANSQGKVVHETLAVLSSEDPAKNYRFATYLRNGMTGVHELKVVGDHFEWGFEIPKTGTVRYTIRIEGDIWSEIGEFSRDGKTWVKTFEMKLDRVKLKRPPIVGSPQSN
jgi:hypothetical protein